MDEKWRVSRVELLEGGLLFGFVLYDQMGRPSVSFGYADERKRMWAVTMLWQRLRMQSKFSVADLQTIEAGTEICSPSGSRRCFANCVEF